MIHFSSCVCPNVCSTFVFVCDDLSSLASSHVACSIVLVLMLLLFTLLNQNSSFDKRIIRRDCDY